MRPSVLWSVQAERALRSMHWRTASDVDAAVLSFAAGDPSSVERDPSDKAAPFRLRVSGHVVRLSVDLAHDAVRVWSIWRATPHARS